MIRVYFRGAEFIQLFGPHKDFEADDWSILNGTVILMTLKKKDENNPDLKPWMGGERYSYQESYPEGSWSRIERF